MSFLQLQHLKKSYDGKKLALKDFSLQIEKGQSVSLIGESGSGKSTLLRIVAGLEDRTEGEVILGGKRVPNPKDTLIPGVDEIQLVYQDYHLYPNSTVEENIARPLLQYDKTYKTNRIKSILKLIGMEVLKDRFPRNLSGGQQQKVAIGRALALEPEVLLLDEPFSSLDSIQRRELIAELKTMFEQLNITVLFVTHDLDDALQMAKHLVILEKGKIIQQGDAESIFSNPKNLYAAKLFSHLNAIPENAKRYIRPSDIRLYKQTGMRTKVLESQYLVHYNQLLVQLPNGEHWFLEDKNRFFKKGDRVFIQWDEEKEIQL